MWATILIVLTWRVVACDTSAFYLLPRRYSYCTSGGSGFWMHPGTTSRFISWGIRTMFGIGGIGSIGLLILFLSLILPRILENLEGTA